MPSICCEMIMERRASQVEAPTWVRNRLVGTSESRRNVEGIRGKEEEEEEEEEGGDDTLHY